MNLLHLVSVLGRYGFKVESAVGTDFSPVLIEAANKETQSYLGSSDRGRVRFCVAKNERLLKDLAAALKTETKKLEDSFHFIFGVNTIRYCHAAGNEAENAQNIYLQIAHIRWRLCDY
jgi:hypothetical protein